MPHILIADRNITDYYDLARTFGESIVFADSIDVAQSLVDRHSPDILILDAGLPGGEPLSLLQGTSLASTCYAVIAPPGQVDLVSISQMVTTGIRHLFTTRPDCETLTDFVLAQLAESRVQQQREKVIDTAIHDLNNALNGFTYLELLAEDTEIITDSAQAQLDRSVSKISTVVTQLNALARTRDAKPVLIQLDDVIPGMQTMLAHQIASDITLSIHARPAAIYIDPDHLQYLVFEMLTLICDTMAQPRSISLSVTGDERHDLLPGPVVLIEMRGLAENTHDPLSDREASEFKALAVLVEQAGGIFETDLGNTAAPIACTYFAAATSSPD